MLICYNYSKGCRIGQVGCGYLDQGIHIRTDSSHYLLQAAKVNHCKRVRNSNDVWAAMLEKLNTTSLQGSQVQLLCYRLTNVDGWILHTSSKSESQCPIYLHVSILHGLIHCCMGYLPYLQLVCRSLIWWL